VAKRVEPVGATRLARHLGQVDSHRLTRLKNGLWAGRAGISAGFVIFIFYCFNMKIGYLKLNPVFFFFKKI
jgi:hypothetical protein